MTDEAYERETIARAHRALDAERARGRALAGAVRETIADTRIGRLTEALVAWDDERVAT